MTVDAFQWLYDLEINFKVSCFWDGGFDVALGDEMNGWEAETTVEKWDEVAPWLLTAASARWPFVAEARRRTQEAPGSASTPSTPTPSEATDTPKPLSDLPSATETPDG